jgi:hypothetical protein
MQGVRCKDAVSRIEFWCTAPGWLQLQIHAADTRPIEHQFRCSMLVYSHIVQVYGNVQIPLLHTCRRT